MKIKWKKIWNIVFPNCNLLCTKEEDLNNTIYNGKGFLDQKNTKNMCMLIIVNMEINKWIFETEEKISKLICKVLWLTKIITFGWSLFYRIYFIYFQIEKTNLKKLFNNFDNTIKNIFTIN